MNAPAIRPTQQQAAILESVLAEGDLSKLTSADRVSYYMQVCRSRGLNPYTRPFDYVRLSGKLVLYAKKDATDQLRKIDHISLAVTSQELADDVYCVTVRATSADGRTDEDQGAVAVAGLRGEARANAYMKALTKAKRRVTLSICGMGMLDESEIESVPGAIYEAPTPLHAEPPQQEEAPRQLAPAQDEEARRASIYTAPRPLREILQEQLDAATDRDAVADVLGRFANAQRILAGPDGPQKAILRGMLDAAFARFPEAPAEPGPEDEATIPDFDFPDDDAPPKPAA